MQCCNNSLLSKIDGMTEELIILSTLIFWVKSQKSWLRWHPHREYIDYHLEVNYNLITCPSVDYFNRGVNVLHPILINFCKNCYNSKGFIQSHISSSNSPFNTFYKGKYSYSSIVQQKEKWDHTHIKKTKQWDSPLHLNYFHQLFFGGLLLFCK